MKTPPFSNGGNFQGGPFLNSGRRTIPKMAFCQNASLTMADEVLQQFVGFDRIPW